jgi:hypothetical protein
MGWLGYTEQETLDTTMPALVMAYEEKIKMLRLCFGGGEDETTEAEAKPAAVQDVQNAFRTLAG